MICSCGERYEDFRATNEGGRVYTFGDVRSLLWNQPDPNRPGWWRQKTRRAVLGYWRELKLQQWEYRHGYCERSRVPRRRHA